MASFTGNAPVAGTTVGVNAPRPAPSFLSGALDTAGTALTGLAKQWADEGVNQAAIDLNQNDVQFDSSTRAQADTQAATTQLTTAKTAEDQGRAGQGSYDISLQNLSTSLMSKYPDQAAAIAQEFRNSGHSNYMFQALKGQQDQQLLLAKAKTDDFIDNYKYGLANTVTTGMTDQQIADTGGNLRRLHGQYQAAKDAAEAATAEATAENTNAQFQLNNNKRIMVSSLFGEVEEKVTPMLEQLNQFVSAATDDPGRAQRLIQMVPLIKNTIESMRSTIYAEAAASHLSPTDLKPIDDRLTQLSQEASLPENFTSANKAVLDNIQSTFALKLGQAFPVYSQLKSLLGPQQLAIWFGPNGPPLPDATKQALQREMAGMGSLSDPSGHIALQEAAATLKGQLKLPNVTPANIPTVISANIAGAKGAAKAIAGGDKSADTGFNFFNAYSNLIDAAHSIQPQGSPDPDSITKAASVIASPTARQTTELMINNPVTRERGQALMLGSRGAAEHLLQASMNQTTPSSFSQTARAGVSGTYAEAKGIGGSAVAYNSSVKYDPKAGLFIVQSDGPTPRPLITTLQQTADTQNQLLNHLAETTKYDDTMPKGATSLSLRNFYAGKGQLMDAKGRPIVAAAKGPSADQIFNQNVDQYENRVRQMPAQLADYQTNMTKISQLRTKSVPVVDAALDAAAQKYKPDSMTASAYSRLLRGLAMQESTKNNDAKSPTGVIGLMQVTTTTARHYGQDRHTFDGQVISGAHYLMDLINDNDGDVRKALRLYNGGGDPYYADRVLHFAGQEPDLSTNQQEANNGSQATAN